jgi:hypothetical protein
MAGAPVTVVDDTVWRLESKLFMRGKRDVDPASFKAYAVALPGRNTQPAFR